MEKFMKMLKENSLIRRVMLGLVFAAVMLCFVLCIVFLIWMAESIYWLIGLIACGMLAGVFGGTLFHLAVIEGES